jgi:hypothetical protein
MKHLTFYFAIGFLVVGCLMLLTGLSTLIGMGSRNNELAGTATLGLTMLLPFVISGLSWRDWQALQRGEEKQERASGAYASNVNE